MSKLFVQKKEKEDEKSKRVTTGTIEEHREQVLANGRKFKYPFQYAKHKLVINTIIIGVVAMVLFVGFGWLQLYKFQNMSDIFFRLTKVVSVPVARVDGKAVRFSDYMMIFRSSMTALENQQGVLGDEEGDRMVRAQYKRQAMDGAVAFTFALKLGEELGVEIGREQILEASREHRTVDGVERSEESFAKIVKTNFGLNVDEYERLLMLSLMKREVSAKIDEGAIGVAGEVERLLVQNGGDFGGVAEALSGRVILEDTGGLVGEMNLDGGRAMVAMGLEVGKWSERFLSRNGDGWYFVKLVGKAEGQVNYVSLRVPFGEFERRLAVLREEGRVVEYIHIETWDAGVAKSE